MKGAVDSQLGNGCSDLDFHEEHRVQHPVVMHGIRKRKQRSTAHHAYTGDTEGSCDKTCSQMVLHGDAW